MQWQWSIFFQVRPFRIRRIAFKGYEGQQIEDYLDARKSKANICTVMQEERLGTGHAVMQAADFLKAHAEGNTLILCGDARVENPTGYGRDNPAQNGISGIVERGLHTYAACYHRDKLRLLLVQDG